MADGIQRYGYDFKEDGSFELVDTVTLVGNEEGLYRARLSGQ